MRKLIILILLIGNFIVAKSQEGSTQDWTSDDQKTFEAATELFNKRYYESAYEKYVSLEKNHSDDLFLKFVRGVCAVYINNKHKEAEKLLLEVKKNNSNAENIDYYLALLFHKSYRFDKAIELTNGLLSNPNLTKEDRVDLERIAFFSKNGKNEIQYPFETFIESMGQLINTEYAEYAPVISPDEESIIFTYRGKGSMGGLVDSKNKPDPNGDYNEDIFISKKVNGVWQKAEGITELNTIGNDAAVAMSPDGKLLFIFKSEGDNGDIYVSKREGGKYLSAEKLPGEVNTEYWEGSVSLSTDQQKLYFSSNRPGGFGGNDLYVATKKEDGTWGNVKNLGSKINTEYDEDAPFISPDSRTLIFSSEGHNSIGDFDLFTSNLDLNDGTWKAAKNLGYPVNTTDDDLFYVLSADGKRGYFSSGREGGKGDQDLYVVEPALASKKSYITTIKGKVTENQLPFETEILVGVVGDTKNYGAYKSGSASGNYVVNLPTGKNYRLTFLHPLLGEKVYAINTEQVEDYAEKTVNVNFNTKTADKQPIKTIIVTKADSAKTEPIGVIAANAPKTNSVAAKTTETKTADEGSIANNTNNSKTSDSKTPETKTKENKSGKKNTSDVKTTKTEGDQIAITSGKESTLVKPTKNTASEKENSEPIAKSSEKNSSDVKTAKSSDAKNDETKITKTTETKSSDVKPTKTIAKAEDDAQVANASKEKSAAAIGDHCNKIRRNHDADFVYRKCNSVWYTKSKTNAYSKYAKGFFKEWTSLSGNTLANEKLDKRYPND